MKLKPTNTYVMSKTVKTLLAGITDPYEKSEFKKLMIEAELVAALRPREKPKTAITKPE
jgi:hypothetical protein